MLRGMFIPIRNPHHRLTLTFALSFAFAALISTGALAQSTVTGNVGGIELLGGTIESAGNNFITDSISGTLTKVGTK